MNLTWISIFRLGLVQLTLGALVVITTSTLNRLMVVEYGLAASIPGLLVAFHYGVQITRPSWGHFSDNGGKRPRWIIGGVGILCLGTLLACLGVTLFSKNVFIAYMTSILAYAFIGLGVGAAGTCLLALLASGTAERRRAAAATITWLMMIFGIAVTAVSLGQFLDPFSPNRLILVVLCLCGFYFLVTNIALLGIENKLTKKTSEAFKPNLLEGLKEVWSDRKAKNFTIFVFLSMTAFFMQELILEPYAGLVFNYTVGESTTLSGKQNFGIFIGMLTVGILVSGLKIGKLKNWVVFGCMGSAVALALIAALGNFSLNFPLENAVILLGFMNGIFAVAAIGTMMELAGKGKKAREGTRMGLWGAAQAIAAAFAMLIGTSAVDVMKLLSFDNASAYGIVFSIEALIFLISAGIALLVVSDRNFSVNQNQLETMG